MNRIKELFEKKQTGILSVYFTAGYPALNDTRRIIKGLTQQGVDMIEIGIPFSDPVADGPVIQKSSQIALSNGMSLDLLFRQLENIRKESGIPLILMGYLNPVYKMGMENFVKNCRTADIDGVIIPDLPLEEYHEYYADLFLEKDVQNIMLITPQTPDERIKEIDKLSDGFIYMVSSYATTGAKDVFSPQQINYFKRVNEMNLKNPRLVGFGVSNTVTFKAACQYASGAIVGSAFIRALQEDAVLQDKINHFVKSFRED